MNSYYILERPNNFSGHKKHRKNNSVLRIPQSGEGLGSLLRSFFKWILPAGKSVLSAGKEALKSAAKSNIVKETASALKQEAATAGINLAQSALKGENVKDAAKKQIKNVSNTIGKSVAQSLEQYRPSIQKNKPSNKRIRKTPKLVVKKKLRKDNLG